MSLEIEFKIAKKSETCWRCFDIGLPTNGIQVGETFLVFKNGDICKFSCVDCFNRLKEDISNAENEDGEEWKYV